MDTDLFFHDATLSICASTCIEDALHRLLLCLRRRIPIDFLSLHLFDSGLGTMETAVDVTCEGPIGPTMTTLNRRANRAVQKNIKEMAGKPSVEIFEDIGDHEAGRLIIEGFGIAHAPCLVLDMVHDGRYLGAISLLNLSGTPYDAEHGRLLFALHDPLALATRHYLCRREIEELKIVIQHNARRDRPESLHPGRPVIIGEDAGLKEVMTMVRQIASIDSPVLILGETGTGKEVVAKAIHFDSPRRNRPFVKVNCGGIAPMLIDSELFGHEKGSFTGAIKQHQGYFERAGGGTIFLDEIGELPFEAQARLLRVVQENIVERVGGNLPIKVDTRIIAATHRDLEQMVAAGKFRQDLFFRLNVFPVQVPPLRHRQSDLPALVHHMIRKKNREMSFHDIPRVAPGAIDRLIDYPWPGNVRELENVVERELIVNREAPIDFQTMGVGRKVWAGPDEAATLDRIMADHITRILRKTGGQVEGRAGAARILGLHPRTLRHRMEKLAIPFGRKANGRYDRNPAKS